MVLEEYVGDGGSAFEDVEQSGLQLVKVLQGLDQGTRGGDISQ